MMLMTGAVESQQFSSRGYRGRNQGKQKEGCFGKVSFFAQTQIQVPYFLVASVSMSILQRVVLRGLSQFQAG